MLLLCCVLNFREHKQLNDSLVNVVSCYIKTHCTQCLNANFLCICKDGNSILLGGLARLIYILSAVGCVTVVTVVLSCSTCTIDVVFLSLHG